MRGLSPRTAQHFRRDGRAKRAYPTRQDAEVEAERHHKRVYLCDFCKRWHIGGTA